MTIIGSSKKPGARLATGWSRGFENLPELTKREQADMLAEAARNTAAIKPPEEKIRD